MLNIIVHNYWSLLEGVTTTLLLSLFSFVVAAPIGLVIGFGCLSRIMLVRNLCALYRSFFRGTPILIQLLGIFYLLPEIGLAMPAMAYAILSLALNSAAFQGEIFSAGFSAIPVGQIESARILGISTWSIRRRIMVPQVVRTMLPALTSEAVTLIKYSSLVSVISVTELTRRSQQIASSTFRPLEAFSLSLAIYLSIVASVAGIGLLVERRLSLRGGG